MNGTGSEVTVEPAPANPEAAGIVDGTWLRLVAPDNARTASAPSLRRVVVQVGAAFVVMLAIVAVTATIIIRNTARQEAVHSAAELSDALAGGVVQPALTDAMAADPVSATALLDPVVRAGILSGPVVRVKLWNPQGLVLYSDEPRLTGRRFSLDSHAADVLRRPHTTAVISDLGRPENQYDHAHGALLEVYRPVWTPNGTPLLLETYFPYSLVTARTSHLWHGFGGIMLSAVGAILVLLIPLGWALVVGMRRAQEQREHLLAHAADASQQERRRIAASLHDGVVQELAAASYSVSAAAQRAADDGDEALARRLREAAGTVRGSVQGLRTLLVDIYPPNLHEEGLAAALRDLVGAGDPRRPEVQLHIVEEAADALAAEVREVVYRVAQECLRNAVNHAHAQIVEMSLVGHQGAVVLTCLDNGVGFDAGAVLSSPETGHLGLRLMMDAAQSVGAALEVRTAPGNGTRWRLTVPAP